MNLKIQKLSNMNIPTVIIISFLLTKTSESLPLGVHDITKPMNIATSNDEESCVGNVPICDSTSKYTENEIRKLLQKHQRKYSPMFGNVIEPSASVDVSLFRSSSLGSVEQAMCRTKRVTLMPRTAYDENMQKRYIVNLDNHLQSVTFETCAETQCYASDMIDTLYIQTRCQQRYSMVRLIYLNEDKNTMEYGKFSILSTCVSTYSRLVK